VRSSAKKKEQIKISKKLLLKLGEWIETVENQQHKRGFVFSPLGLPSSL